MSEAFRVTYNLLLLLSLHMLDQILPQVFDAILWLIDRHGCQGLDQGIGHILLQVLGVHLLLTVSSPTGSYTPLC